MIRLPDEQYLERIGAAGLGRDGVLHPTGAGLLMFGEEYRITRHFNEYFLDYRENMDPSIRWTDRVQSQSGDWSGNVFDFFFRVFGKATRDFPKPFKLEGINRVDDTPLHQAFREALANCFANADFYLPRGLVIIKEPNRIVLQNPGSIRTGLSQMLKGGVSDPRNKGIMKMWNLLKIGERAGSGVPDIYATWRNSGLEAPCVEESFGPDRTTMILPLTKIGLNEANPEANEANPEANSPLRVRIVEELRTNPKATQIGMATRLGVSRATVQRAMNALAKEGRIKRQGGTRGRWVVNE